MTSAKFERMWRFMKENEKCQPDSNDISDDLMCTICKRVMINPHYGTCGCRYCLDCITAYLDGEQKWCPGDKDDCKEELMDVDDNVYFDPVTNRNISRLPMKCPRQFCEFRCEWSKMEEHEKLCQIQPMNCPYVSMGCGETNLSQSMNEHLLVENECHTKLLMACIDGLYNEIGSLKKEVTTEREERQRVVEQQEREVERSNEAMRSMKTELEGEQRRGGVRDEMIGRMKKEMTELRTGYNLATAKNTRLRSEIEQHKVVNMKMAIEKCDLEMEQKKLLYQGNAEKIRELEGKNEFKKLKMLFIMKKFFEESEDNDSLADSAVILRTWVKSLMTEARVDGMEENVQKQHEFIWRVDDCAATWEAARSGTRVQMYSDPFFLYPNGYKMCLSLFPDGFGAGEGTHLGVFFHLMQGPFDNILEWPFKHTVKVSIINQNTRDNYASYSVSLGDSPNSVSRKKPRTERNDGLGKSKLIKLETLSRTPGLCKDDRIFIRCTIVLAKPDDDDDDDDDSDT